MPWKKILITVALVLLILIITVSIILSTVGLNPLKPLIIQKVKDATGRELTINGDITVRIGLTSTLTVNDISFQNVSWGTRPHLATVKRFQVSIKLIPLLTRKFIFTRLTVLEPDILLEVNATGKTNLEFESSEESVGTGAITLPVLVFNDIEIQNGRLVYRVGQYDKTYSAKIDRLNAAMPGLDKNIEVNLDGTLGDNPFSIKSSCGPVLAWLESGYSFPVELTVKAGSASLDVKGDIKDPVNFSNMVFNITANGPSTRDIFEIVGMKEALELGAFELEARIADTKGELALEKFDFQLGSEKLVAITCNGEITDLKLLKGVIFDFNIKGEDTANLAKSGLPKLPVNGPFSVSGHISDPESGIYSLSNLKVILVDNIVNGQIDLNTSAEIPFLTADMASEQFDFGKLALSAKLTGLTGRPALEVTDFQVGKEELAQLKITGDIGDLVSQKGVDLKFSARGKDIGNIKEIVGKPIPVKGSFEVSGEISDVETGVFEVAPLDIVLGENRIAGRMDLNLAGQQPNIRAEMSAKSFNLSPLSLEGNEFLTHITNLKDLGPLDMKISVTGLTENIVLDKLEFQAGREDLVKININGSVIDMVMQKGIDLVFDVQGKDIANLRDLVGKAIPAKGAYIVSGHITDSGRKNYKIVDLKLDLGETSISGWMDLKMEEKQLRLLSELSSDNFTFRSTDIPDVKQRNYIHDFSPMKLAIDMTRSENSVSLKTLNFSLGSVSLDVKGEIKGLVNFSNLVFNINANGPSTREIFKMAGIKEALELGAFNLRARIDDTEGELALEKFDFQLGSEELIAITCNGEISDLTSLKGVLFDFTVKGKNTSNLLKSGLPKLPVNGPFSVSGHISDPESGIYSLSNFKVILADNIINGQIDMNTNYQIPFMTADMESEQFDFGKLALSAKITGFTETLALEELDLQAGNEKLAHLNMNGSIKDLISQEGVDLKFEVQGKDVGNLKEIVGKPVPVNGGFKVSGEISDVEARVFEVTPLEIVLGENKITGRVDLNLAGQQPNMTAEMTAKSFNLGYLTFEGNDTLTRITNLKDLGPLDMKISVADFKKNIALDRFEIQAGREDLIKVDINGSVMNLASQEGIDLLFDIQGTDIANLKEIIGKKIPAKGSYNISGNITDPDKNSYKVADLKLTVGETNINGWVDLTMGEQESRMLSELSSDNFTLRSIDIPAITQQDHIHDLGPMNLAIDLTRSGSTISIKNLDFNLGSTDLIEATINGRVKDLPALQELEFDFLIHGKEAANLLKSNANNMSFKGPFEVSGQFIAPAPKIIKLPSLKVVVGDRVSKGSFDLDLTQKPPYLKIDSTSPRLDLRPFLTSTDKDDDSKSITVEPEVKKEKVFSDSPWPLDALKSFNSDINIRNKKILLPRLVLEDVKIDASLKDGNLDMSPIQFTIGSGSAGGDFRFIASEENPTLDLDLKIDQLDIASMLDELGYKSASEGKVDVDINLSGVGRSLAEQMASLNGDIIVITVDALTESKNLNTLNKYLGTDILRMLNPFDSEDPQTPINCLVTGIDIKDGFADLKIVLDTDQTTLFCAGDIDLKTEKLDIGIKPTPKKGFGTKDANISFSLNDLSQPFGLGGTLAAPSMKLDIERTLFTMGKFAGAMMLGPVGIAAFFADVSLGKADSCEVAIKSAREGDFQIEDTVNEEIVKDRGY